MKAKKLLVFLLALVIVLTLSVAACKPEENPPAKTDAAVEVTSSLTPTIEVGQEYSLTYSSNDTVTVSASGGNYNQNTQKFSASSAGTYTLTVTASGENKNDKVVTVTITVTASAANKEALAAAISGLTNLVESDYTSASWRALTLAKEAAQDVYSAAGKTQAEVDKAKTDLDKAKTELVKAAIDKAVVSESQITYAGSVYTSDDYNNISAVGAEISELNADSTIALKSQYVSQINAILAKLDKKIELDFVNVPNGVMLVTALRPYQFEVKSEAGANVVVKINNQAVEADEGKYTITPSAFDTDYVITATASKGEKSNSKSVTVSFAKTVYTSNKGDAVTVTDDVISINDEGLSWGDNKGKKVVLDDVAFAGNFSVTFDVIFTHHNGDAGNANVMALFFWAEDGGSIAGKDERFVALCQQNSWLEVTTEGSQESNKSRKPINENNAALDLNKTYRIRVTRKIVDNNTTLLAELLSDTGKVLFVNEGKGTIPYSGAVKLGIQAENAKFTVSNMSVNTAECIVSKVALRAELNRVNNLALSEEDYTAESWTTFNSALTSARTVLNATGKTQAEIKAAVDALTAAINGLVAKPVEKYENVYDETAKTITWEGVTYTEAIASNIEEVIAELKAIDNDADLNQSEYEAAYIAAIEKIELSLTVSVNGLPQGNLLVSQLKSYEFTAVSNSEDAEVTVTINGTPATANEGKYTLTPAQFGVEYKVVATAALGEGASISANYAVTFVKTQYETNVSGAKVENDVISITEGYGWDDNRGKKVVLDDMLFVGDFSITFDLTFTEHRGDAGNANVMALFLLKSDGSSIDNWVAVCQHSNLLEVANGGGGPEKPQFSMPDGTTAVNNTIRIRVTRTVTNGLSYTMAELIDIATGRPLTLKKGDVEYTSNMGYKNGDQPDGERLGRKDNIAPIMIGFQSENVSYTVKNIVVDKASAILNVSGLNAAIESVKPLIESDYTEATWEILQTKLSDANGIVNAAKSILASAIKQQKIDEATKALTDAVEALEKIAVIEPVVTMKGEEPDQTVEKIVFNGVEYPDTIYGNLDEIYAEIAALEKEGVLNSVYEKQVLDCLDKLAANYTLTIQSELKVNQLVKTLTEQTFTVAVAEDNAPELTYVWKVGGVVIEGMTTATLTWTPESFDNYVITVQASDADGKLSNIATFEFSLVEVEPYIPDQYKNEQGANFDNNVFHIGKNAGWDPWQGRKIAFEDLIINGSFEFAIEYVVKEYVNPGVVTIHMMNADTLTLRASRDNARVGYMAINTQNNKIEVNDGGRKTDLGDAVKNYASQVNSKVRLTLRAEKQTDNTYILTGMLDVVLADGTKEHREYRDNNRTGSMGSGMIIGLNIENISVDVTSFSYKLLEGDGIKSGSVQNKLELHRLIEQCEQIDLAQYVNAIAFREALDEAKRVYGDNSATANHAAAVKALNEAKDALVEKDVAVSVNGLDQGYNNFSNPTLTAVIADGVEGRDTAVISWSYKLDDAEEATTVSGATLANLVAGNYSEVTLTIVIGEDTYIYSYQDFAVTAIELKSNTDRVVVDDDAGKVTVTDGAGWDQQDQLVLSGIRTQNFTITYNIKQTTKNYDPANKVACLNIFGIDQILVLGYKRSDAQGNVSIGFNENGAKYKTITGDDAALVRDGTVKVVQSVSVDANGIAHITFTIIGGEDNHIIYTDTYEMAINHLDSATELRMKFENVSVELSDFEVMYKDHIYVGQK